MPNYDWIIVGAGYTGAVLAERIATELDQRVLVIDRRDHIAGNAYDHTGDYGLTVHKYGPHIFHTNSDKVWEYLSRFTGWRPYEHCVQGEIDGQLAPIPFNLNSLDKLFPAKDAELLSKELVDTYGFGKNVPILKMKEDGPPGLKSLADYIYAKIFENYTLKQWSLRPEQLDPGVSARVPVRISRDDRYFQDAYQAMPDKGYTAMFERILKHPNIRVSISTEFKELPRSSARVIFTGPIDEYFNYEFGALPYRSLDFRFFTADTAQVQPVGTVNYPNDHAYTRITEFKHLTGESGDHSVLVEEYPQAYEPGKNEPYYPIPTSDTAEKLKPYQAAARALEGKVWFAGRLGDYAYYNMDQACGRALALFEKQIVPAVRGASAVARRYLLVVRAGDRSLHPRWLKPADAPRLWDLHISYFGDKDAPFGDLPEGVTLSREKGPKYLGLAECLNKHPDFMTRYTHLGFPDDDLACDVTAWNTAFTVLDEIGADLGQPALDPRSFFSYDIVLRRAQFRYRETDFVELMCPIFSAAFLREMLPTWTLNKSSWGLDFVWRETARREGRKIAIVDSAHVLHTRAIGKGMQYSAANMQGATQHDEYKAVLSQFNITDTSRNVLRGVRSDGSVLTNAFWLNRRLKIAGLRRKMRTAFNVSIVRD